MTVPSKFDDLPLPEERVIFLYEFGIAFNLWAIIEMTLAELTADLVQPADRWQFIHGYLTNPSFIGRMAFTNSVAHDKLGNSESGELWAQLYGRLRSGNELRNRLAHWTQSVFNGPPGRRWLLARWNLKAPVKLRPLTVRPPDGAMYLTDVAKVRWEYHALMLALQDFRLTLRGGQPIYGEVSGEVKIAPTLAQVVSMFREYLATPASPKHAGSDDVNAPASTASVRRTRKAVKTQRD